MRVLALCMLLLQAWACPTVVAGAASVEGTSTISLSQQVSQSHNALGMVDVDLFQEDDQVIGARRQLLKKKKSPPKKGRSKKPSKKPFKKPSKKSTKKSKKKSPKKGKPGKPGKSGTPGFPGFDGTPGGPGSNGADGIPGTPGANAPAGAPGLAGPPGTPASLGLPTGVSAVALGYNNAIYKGPALEGSVAGTPGDFVDTVLRFNVDCNFLNTNQAARDQFALYIRLSIALDLGLYDNAGNLELWRVQIIAGPSCGSTLYTIRIFFFNRPWSSTTISARLLGGNPFISGTPFFNQYRAIFIVPTPVIIPSPVVG